MSWLRLRYWRLPKLDVRRVTALWQINANRVASAVDTVVLAKLVTHAGGLNAHDRVDVGVGRFGRIGAVAMTSVTGPALSQYKPCYSIPKISVVFPYTSSTARPKPQGS